MIRLMLFAIVLFGTMDSVHSQTMGKLIGQGRKFDNYGEVKTGYYKVMLEMELLKAVVVEENGSMYLFNILSSNKTKENKVSLSFDIEADHKGDSYYLALTVSKDNSDCLLIVFEGTKSDWHAEKVAARSYGFYNY